MLRVIKDLTEGKESSVLWRFSIPMFVGVIFQQLYNIADSVIAGTFAGEDALAAVGASYPITMLFMAVAIGSQIGCSVVVSQLFGSKQYKDLKTTVSTSMIAGFVLSVVLTGFGLLLSRLFMQLLNTPDNIMRDADLYLKIYTGGFVFLYLYNVATGIFNSLGDSKTPLYFLIASSISNVALDLLFVIKFQWGVQGVAWATFIAQGISCVLSLVFLSKRLGEIGTTEKYKRFDKKLLEKIASIAIPSIIQQSFISVGNLFIQKLVNGYGSSAIAGYSAAIKLNTFAITSFATLGNGVSGFTAQNIGAGKIHRVRKAWSSGVVLSLGVAAFFFMCYFFFGKSFLGFFMNAEVSQNAMTIGNTFLHIVAPFYFVICIKLISDGVLRGSGSMVLFMIATFADLILRVILAFILSNQFGVTGIWMSWPIGWTISMILSFIFYRSGKWKTN